MRLLLARGAATDQGLPAWRVDAHTPQCSSLMLAARQGHAAAVGALLEGGARPDLVLDGRGTTALMWATGSDRRRAESSVAAADERVRSWEQAEDSARAAVVRLLLAHGAAPGAESADGDSAVGIARQRGLRQCCSALSVPQRTGSREALAEPEPEAPPAGAADLLESEPAAASAAGELEPLLEAGPRIE